MASVHLSPTQSPFVVPIQSSSIGSGSSSGVNNEGNQFPIPHVYNSSISLRRTQDLFSSDLEREAIKSNLASQVVVPCNDFCEEDYIFSKDLFTNDDAIPSYNSSSKPIEEYIQGLSSSSSSDQYQSSEISPVTVSSVITGAIGSAITSKSKKSSRGRRSKDQMLAVYGNEWRPIGVDLKGFNIDQLAPGNVYDSNQLYFTNPHLNKRLYKKVEGPCAVAIVVWPSLNMQNSVYSYKNEKRGRLECFAPCGSKKETCRFHVNFRRVLVRVFLHVSFHMIVKLVSVLKASIARTFRLRREEEIISLNM